jgi:hypothetical protein
MWFMILMVCGDHFRTIVVACDAWMDSAKIRTPIFEQVSACHHHIIILSRPEHANV